MTAAQLEAQLASQTIGGVAGLAGTLTELKLNMPTVTLTSIAPLAALRRLRRLRVASGDSHVPLLMPAPAQYPCLEEFDLGNGGTMQARRGWFRRVQCASC